MSDDRDPLDGPGERELAVVLHAALTKALDAGVDPQGAMEAISSILGAMIGGIYAEPLHRPVFDAFCENTWNAVVGYQIYSRENADEVGR